MVAVSIRTVKPSDKDWIVQLLKEGACNGHFADTIGTESEQLFLQVVSKAWLQTKQIRNNQNQRVFQFATIYVSETDGFPTGFALCVTDSSATELHLAAVNSRYRNNGHFSALVTHAIEHFNAPTLLSRLPLLLFKMVFFCAAICLRMGRYEFAYWNWCSKKHRLFARCYPTSTIAKKVLIKHGFSKLEDKDGLTELTWQP